MAFTLLLVLVALSPLQDAGAAAKRGVPASVSRERTGEEAVSKLDLQALAQEKVAEAQTAGATVRPGDRPSPAIDTTAARAAAEKQTAVPAQAVPQGQEQARSDAGQQLQPSASEPDEAERVVGAVELDVVKPSLRQLLAPDARVREPLRLDRSLAGRPSLSARLRQLRSGRTGVTCTAPIIAVRGVDPRMVIDPDNRLAHADRIVGRRLSPCVE